MSESFSISLSLCSLPVKQKKEITKSLDITETAVREHLATLEDQRYVNSYPKKMYKITPEGRGLFPSKNGDSS